MDIDDLKKRWRTLDVPDTDVRAVERKVTSGGRVLTLRDKLMRISRCRVFACLAGALCMFPLAAEHPAMTVMVVIFFAVMGVMHLLQLHNLRTLNPSVATVRETLERVLRIETFRTRRRIIGIIMAVPMSIYIIFTMTNSYGAWMFPACIAGGLTGCAAAVLVKRRSARLLREIKRELAEDFSAS